VIAVSCAEAQFGWAAGRITLGAVFIIAAVAKLRGLDGFVESFAAGAGLPNGLSRASAYAICIGELALAGALLLSKGAVLVPASAALFLVVATAFLIRLRKRGGGLGCNCFGVGQRPVGWVELVRNALLIALAVALSMVERSCPHMLLSDVGVGDLVVIVACLSVGGAALVTLSRAVDLLTGPGRTGPSGGQAPAV
jgi:uncharacterized membrane protein YphA (DoxX/SURF4 family)